MTQGVFLVLYGTYPALFDWYAYMMWKLLLRFNCMVFFTILFSDMCVAVAAMP